MRDLDRIREQDDREESGRTALLGFGGLAIAGVLFVVGVAVGRDSDAAPGRNPGEDPLERLDALAGHHSDGGSPVVTYPERLVDRPGTAQTAATAAPPPGTLPGATPLAPTAPLPMAAAAPPVNVPAAALVDVTGRVRETLPPVARLPVASANPQLRVTPASPAQAAAAGNATPGAEGPFSLQVSAFKTVPGAQSFAARLRERGYRAFVSNETVTINGAVWHRVRIGPFNSLGEASRFRTQFETRERLPTFVVRREAPQAARAATRPAVAAATTTPR